MTDAHERNLELQQQWYGELLGTRFRRLLGRLGLSQAQLAGVLGLSAPMLSQLMSGQRAKISNPAVLSRVLQLEAMAADPGWDAVPQAERERRLDELRATKPTTLTLDPVREAPPAETQSADPVLVIQSLLRDLASASELEGAAELLNARYPELAEALRVLGAGRTQEARAYYTRITARR